MDQEGVEQQLTELSLNDEVHIQIYFSSQSNYLFFFI